jgi:L-seryl-tRNA(Ser) seleniumtransferase
VSDPRRGLPAVHELVRDAERAGFTERAPRAVVTDAVRDVLDGARGGDGREPEGGWLAAVEREVERQVRPALQRVVNATGVVLHTNLGRAPLARAAEGAMREASGYTALEYDVAEGVRGSRQSHVGRLLSDLTGAEAAFVATNAAAALLLVVNTVSEGRETIVSRGELVEIGGSFRLPEILAKSGGVLVEVGTTNRTRLRDYELAVGPRTGAILKVHRSNFTMQGFVSEVPLGELVALGLTRGIPIVHDVGSGLLVSLEAHGLTGEPLVPHSVAAGALVVFSGDKLLGGPQAGIVLGPGEAIRRVAENPLARALRPDKTILAALEATLALYREPDAALREIPVLAMLTMGPDALRERAARLAALVPRAATVPGYSAVGGGAFPHASLATTVVALDVPDAGRALADLRRAEPPIVARIEEGRLIADVRTIADHELAHVGRALAALATA